MLTPVNPTERPRRSWRFVLAVIATAVALLTPWLSAQVAEALARPALTAYSTTTAIRVSWPANADATDYTVQWSKSSSFSSPSQARVTGTRYYLNYLSATTTYYVRVKANQGADQKWSPSNKAKTGKPRSVKPTGLAVDNITGTSLELSWVGTPSTWAYLVRVLEGTRTVQWAEASGTYTTVEGLKRDTAYTVRVYPAVGSNEDIGAPAMIDGTASSAKTVRTSKYYDAPPKFKVTKQYSTGVKLGWDPIPADQWRSGYQYRVQYALNTAMTRGLKSQTTRSTAAAATGPDTTSMTLTGLKSNTPYYVRLHIVDANGKQVSDKTGYRMAKTLIPQGQITGTVAGPRDADVLAEAYDSDGELAGWAEVKGGKYSLSLRPSTTGYRVRLSYIGRDGFTSAWFRTGTPAGRQKISDATRITVANGKESAVHPAVTLAKGAGFSGTVKARDTNTGRSNVDVTVSHGEQVVAKARTNGDGKYTIAGLRPNQSYRVRFAFHTDGYKKKTVSILVKADGKLEKSNSTTLNATLDVLDWYRTYGVRVSGLKQVGSTVTANAPAWVAGTFPATHSTREFRWKRNGVTVKTEKSSLLTKVATYRLTSADRGKRLTLTVVHSRPGYRTTSKTSTGYVVR